MKQLYGKKPQTIIDELKAQIKYCKNIGRFKNNTEISLEIRKLEENVFGEERKYTTDAERKGVVERDNTTRSVRPQTINDLYKIDDKREISSYFLLFSAFKTLNIIKEDFNIIQLFDHYGIKPTKNVDIERLEKLREDYEIIKKEKCVKFCYGCIIEGHCANYNNCLYVKIKNKLKQLSIEEQIEYLYKLGFPSCFDEIQTLPHKGDYRLSISSLKVILQELGENDKLDFVNKLEEKYIIDSRQRIEKKKQELSELDIKIKKQKLELKELKNKDTKDLKLIQKIQNKQFYLEEKQTIRANKSRDLVDREYSKLLFIVYKKCILNQYINNIDETFEDFL